MQDNISCEVVKQVLRMFTECVLLQETLTIRITMRETCRTRCRAPRDIDANRQPRRMAALQHNVHPKT